MDYSTPLNNQDWNQSLLMITSLKLSLAIETSFGYIRTLWTLYGPLDKMYFSQSDTISMKLPKNFLIFFQN